jgi:pyruvate dehydrogenase E1 component
LHPDAEPRVSHAAHCLSDCYPVIAATDYVAASPQLISAYVDNPFGTDGFGRSDARAALRGFFEVDRSHIIVAALTAVADQRHMPRSVVSQAIEKYGVNTEIEAPWNR